MQKAKSDMVTWIVAPESAGEHLDKAVARMARVSRRIARMWISGGRVQVNGKTMRILTRPLRAGSRVQITPPVEGAEVSSGRHKQPHSGPRAEASPTMPPSRDGHVPLQDHHILYLDQWMVAIHKPAGLLSESDRFGGPSIETMLPRLLSQRGEKKTALWLVHRLDAGTTGVMVLARTPLASTMLGQSFRESSARKTYYALCKGRFAEACDVDAPIARVQGTLHGVDPKGKPAQTRFEVMAQSDDASWVAAFPRTGRTHQIRVHLAHLGHPILGDRRYGGPGYTSDVPALPLTRPFLHAYALQIPHPKTHAPLRIEAPVPDDFKKLALRLGLRPAQSI